MNRTLTNEEQMVTRNEILQAEYEIAKGKNVKYNQQKIKKLEQQLRY